MSKPSGLVHRDYHAQIVEAKDAEITRLTAALSDEQDRRSDVIRESNEAIEEARAATGANRILKAEVPRLEAEIARLTAELAAARAVPADVEGAIGDLKIAAADFGIAQDGVTFGRAFATEHRGEASARMRSAADHLRTAIARAINDATGKRDAEWQKRIAPIHPNRTGDGCDSGDPIDWTFAALMLARIDVESDAHDEGHRAAMRDATAARGTVGGLLATAREGDIIEFDEGSWWMQVMAFGGVVRWRVHDADANGWHPYIDDPSSWHCDELVAFWLTKPARLVPPDIADLDPATRGPLPKGGDR